METTPLLPVTMTTNESLATNESMAANETSPYLYPLPTTITIGILMSIMAVATFVLNCLTVIAFINCRTLRNYGDYFILNLAIADLGIGSMCIPSYIPYALTGRWSAGKHYCLFWLLWDYILPAASTINMCVITIDRYLLVAHPFWYRGIQTPLLLRLLMVSPWVLVVCVFTPPILMWEALSGEDAIPPGTCHVPYSQSIHVLLIGSVIEFIVPFFVMATVNLLIFLNLRNRRKRRPGNEVRNSPGRMNVFSVNKVAPEPSPQHQEATATASSSSSSSSSTSSDSESVDETCAAPRPPQQTSPTSEPGEQQQRKSSQLRQDRRAARSLFVLVFVFALCWMPYEVLALVTAVCPDCIDPLLFEVSFWLLWVNSTINPILYPLLHARFRKALYDLLDKVKGKCRRS